MEGSPGSGDGPDGKRRRPQPPILDLKATDVTTQAASTASAAAESSAQAAGPAAPVAAAPPEPEGAQSVEPGPTPAQGDEAATAPRQAEDDRASPGVGAAETIQPHAIEADSAPPDTATAVPPAVPPRPRLGKGYAFASAGGAAFGAAVMLAGAWMVGLPSRTDERATDTAARIGLLEMQLGELASRPAAPSAPTAPDSGIAELAARLAAAEQALAQVKALEARLAQAEAALGRTPQGTADPELGKRVAAVDEAAKSLTAALADLRRRVDEVATIAQAAREAAAARPPSGPGAPSAAVAGLTTELQNLAHRLVALEAAAKELQTSLAGVDAVTKELQAGLAASAKAPDRDREARFAAAALALRQAVEAGAPFGAELAAVKALSEDAARLASLEPFAAAGVPGATVLARELTTAIAAAKPPPSSDDGNTGFFERLQKSAARLVRIRPAEGPASTSPGDPMGRIQAAVARGDFDAALAEAEKLPPAARAPLEPWVQKVRARNAALAAARDLARAGLEALASREPVRR